jgi:hypothetical protein
VATIVKSLQASLKSFACCLPALALACGNAPEAESAQTGQEKEPLVETLVVVGSDGSLSETSRELDSDERAETAKAEFLHAGSAALSSKSELGSLAQPLVASTACLATDLWLYDASGNRLCVRWLGDSDRGLDLDSVRRGQAICGITVLGGVIRCTWAGAVTAYWPGQYSGHLGTCTPRDVGLSCDLPIAFPAWGPQTSVDGSAINWVTMPT